MPSSDTYFKKGHPGGPGRPKGSRGLSTLLREKLDELSDDEVHTWLEKLRDAIISGAIKLKPHVLKALLDRIDPVVQHMQIEPLKIEIEIKHADNETASS